MAALTDSFLRLLRSPAFKFFLILFLILLLSIPLLLVYALVYEREGRSLSVRTEVGRTWGPEQRLIGPLLVVPYTVRVEKLQGDKRVEVIQERRGVFTPQTLAVAGDLKSRVLRRSIFNVPVYAAGLDLTGTFAAPRMEDVVAEPATVRWRDAIVVLSLTGVAGLKEAAVLRLAPGKSPPASQSAAGPSPASAIAFAPSLGVPGDTSNGIHARLALSEPALFADTDKPLAAFAFSVHLAFNGSISLDVAPAARETNVRLASDWPHPSFGGTFLPDQRDVSAKGFSAHWSVPHLARSVPEAWTLSGPGQSFSAESRIDRLAGYAFGVRMIEPVDFYALVNRAAKYGLMFIAAVFMAVFCIELMNRHSVHPVQYILTGLALVLFYVLLLSFAEHIGFTPAYAIAAVATSALLALYLERSIPGRRIGVIVLGVLAATFILLYVILRLEDYALLAGTLLGFVALATVMFVTARIDWSGTTEERRG